MSSVWGFYSQIGGKSVVNMSKVNNDAQSTAKIEDTFKPNSFLLVIAANSCDHLKPNEIFHPQSKCLVAQIPIEILQSNGNCEYTLQK